MTKRGRRISRLVIAALLLTLLDAAFSVIGGYGLGLDRGGETDPARVLWSDIRNCPRSRLFIYFCADGVVCRLARDAGVRCR
jgi:hypothetical protein